jgi:hypothetical protein
LFSNDQIAGMIHHYFEPVWESVRPVPVLTLDFGNGNVLTRTLNGNIASYVCTAEGKVLDVLPGIYDATSYTNQLDQMRLLHGYYRAKPAGERETALREYHRTQADALAKDQQPGHFVEPQDVSKIRIERPAKDVVVRFIVPQHTKPARPARAVAKTTEKAERRDAGKGVIEQPVKNIVAAETVYSAIVRKQNRGKDVAQWAELFEDTKFNEKSRRLLIHLRLTSAPPTPAGLTKWLYAEVLHADLDDPYLGLGPLLSGDYPFKDRADK